MKKAVSKTQRRTWIIINYLCLILIIFLFYSGKYAGWNIILIIAEIAVIAVLIFSFIYIYIRTRLWKFIHTNVKKLDEREIQVTHESLRRSYSILSVISLSYILLLTLSSEFTIHTLRPGGKASLGMIILCALIYLAHTLPASIIAWTDENIYLD